VPGFPVELDNALCFARSTATDAYDAITTLKATCSADPELASLEKEVYGLCTRGKTNTRTIAVLGNTGQGEKTRPEHTILFFSLKTNSIRKK
jgi:hypothetical protein